MVTTYTDRLTKVRAAIDDLLVSGQSTTYNGRTLTMASLDTLTKLEQTYANLAANEARACGGRNRIIQVIPLT